MHPQKFFRFTGRVNQLNEFTPGIGWETARIRSWSPSEGNTMVQLVDARGGVLSEQRVEERHTACRSVEDQDSTRLVAYIPLHEDGVELVLRTGAGVIYRAPLPERAPEVSITQASHDTDALHIAWQASHSRPLWFNVFLTDRRRRTVPVAIELQSHEHRVPLTAVPGGPGCIVSVVATDGLRSTTAHSNEIDLPESLPQVTIIAPVHGQILRPSQPYSLIGAAHDMAGETLNEESFAWFIDGDPVARGAAMAAGPELEPGDHRIGLQVRLEAREPASAFVDVQVQARSDADEAWLRQVDNSW